MSRKNSLGIVLAFILLFSYISIFEVTSTNIATAIQTPSSISDTSNLNPLLWYSPDGSLAKNNDTRVDSTGIASAADSHVSELLPPAESKNQIWLMVNQNIYPTIITTLTQFSNDIQLSGYNVSIITISSDSSALNVRHLLQQGYYNGSLLGTILIGNLPTAWYEMTNPSPWGYETFPIDYYYMDLDCNWTDANSNGVFDNYTFPMQPEIWVARIDASGMSRNETQCIINYLTKDHNYRIGNLVASRQALVYVDDDWTGSADETNLAVQQAYNNTILVKEYGTTNATDYKNRLYSNSYEWVQLMCHGSSTSHTFKINGAFQSESVSSSYYSTANPKALFYNLFVCSGTRFTETNNLAGSILFGNNNWGLLAVGSTKTGSMYNFWDFYQPLDQGKSIGDAFKIWSIMWADSDPKWFYGMNILGDPLLKISQYMLAQNASIPAPTLSPSGSTNVGTSLSLSVTVSGGGVTPSGTASFQVNINGSGWNTIGSSVFLNSSGFASTTYTPLSAGSFQFRVVYSGDSKYNSGTGTVTFLTVNSGKPVNAFVFSVISSPQNAGSAFSITITAKDANGNTVTNYNGNNDLTVSLGAISPTGTTTFAAGVWTGLVTLSQPGTGISISTNGGGKSGTSNMFSVNPGDLVLFSDDFVDLSKWSVVKGVWSVSGGVLQCNSANNQENLIWADHTNLMSYQATANMREVSSIDTSLVVRYTDSGNFYWLGLGCWGHKYSISKAVNGIYQELTYSGSASEVVAGRWYLVSAVAIGNSLQLFVDGVKVLEVQDSSHPIGAVGFRGWNGTMQASHLIIQSKEFNIKLQTNDGGYALAGYTNSFGAGGKDFWLVKTDSVGNQLWNKTYGGLGDEVAYSVIQTNDGGYILSGPSLTMNVPPDGSPYTIHNYDGLWHTSDFTIKLSATDDEFTFVKDTYYIINGGSPKTVNKNGQPFIDTEGANNTLEYWSIDNLGHEELLHNILNGIKLDKTAPTGFILINDGDAYTSSISVTLSSGANEATSGVYQVRYSNDGVWDNENWETPAPTRAWSLTSGDGVKSVYIQVKNNAGLTSNTYSDTIILETTPPTPTATPTLSPSLSPSVTPTVKPSITAMPIASPITTSTPTPSPTAISATPFPSSNQSTSPSASPLSQLTTTPLYLYALAVVIISAISATFALIIKKKR